MPKFSEPYQIGKYWAVDHFHYSAGGCLGWFLNLLGYTTSHKPDVTTYTIEDARIPIFWRNIKTGYRPDVFFESDIQHHFEAWDYRQTMAKIKGTPGTDKDASL